MAARRHLPVLQEPPAPPPPPRADDEGAEPPPWHWIPMGTVVSVLAFALAAPGAAALSLRALGRVYRRGATASEIAAVRAQNPLRANAMELLAGLVPAALFLACVGLGGYVVGRYGPKTNHRHGVLSGACTALVCWLVTGRAWAMLLMVPLAMLIAGAAARVGVNRRDRALSAG